MPPRYLASLILLLGFALRLYRLGYQSLWYDEGVSVFLAQKSLSALTTHTARDIHPPLYYYLLHFWVRLAGRSEFSLAFLSLTFGTLLIALLFLLGRRLYGTQAALLGSLLLAFTPFNLWYSQEVRMYTLGAFWGLLSLLCLLRLLNEEAGSSRLRVWLSYILTSALGLYTLYYFAFLLLAQNLLVLGWWSVRRKGFPISQWALSQGAILFLYLPWLPIALRQATNPPVPPWRSFIGLMQVVVDSWSALSLGESVEPRMVWPLLLITLALFVVGLSSRSRFSDASLAPIFLAGHLLLPLLLIYLFSFLTPLFHVRYIFTYSPPFYLLLGAGVAKLKKPVALLSLLIIFGASGYPIYNFHFEPRYATDDHRGAVAFLEERLRPGDALLINAGYAYPTFLYYYKGPIAWQGRLVDYRGGAERGNGVVILQTGSIGGDENLGWGDPDSDFYPTSEEKTREALERVFSLHPRLWVFRIYDTVTDPQGFIREWLDEHGQKFEDQLFAGSSYMRVQGYLTPLSLQMPGGAEKVRRDLGGVLRLEGYEILSKAGRPLYITLYWRALKRMDVDYHVVLYLVDGDGDVVAQTDEMPLGSLYLTSRWPPGRVLRHPLRLEIPVPISGGEYSLQVGVYDLASEKFLETQEGEQRLRLERFRVGGS